MLIRRIAALGMKHQKTHLQYIKNELDSAVAQLKLIEVNKITKGFIWSNHRYFEYMNKPEKLLANLIPPKTK